MSSNPVLARDLDDDEPAFVPPTPKKKRKPKPREARPAIAMKTPSPAARLAGGIAGVIGFAVAWYGVNRALAPAPAPAKNADMTSVAVLQQIANETNKRMPMEVDRETVLVSVVVPEKGIFEYRYRLVSLSASDFDPATVLADQKPMTRNNSCSTPATRKFIDHGVTLRYSYMDKDGKYFGSFDVTPKDCAQSP